MSEGGCQAKIPGWVSDLLDYLSDSVKEDAYPNEDTDEHCECFEEAEP